ncbi:hypothetical protein PENTCL1PPCAC_9991, partial [Pristionchus entomophagus]
GEDKIDRKTSDGRPIDRRRHIIIIERAERLAEVSLAAWLQPGCGVLVRHVALGEDLAHLLQRRQTLLVVPVGGGVVHSVGRADRHAIQHVDHRARPLHLLNGATHRQECSLALVRDLFRQGLRKPLCHRGDLALVRLLLRGLGGGCSVRRRLVRRARNLADLQNQLDVEDAQERLAAAHRLLHRKHLHSDVEGDDVAGDRAAQGCRELHLGS